MRSIRLPLAVFRRRHDGWRSPVRLPQTEPRATICCRRASLARPPRRSRPPSAPRRHASKPASASPNNTGDWTPSASSSRRAHAAARRASSALSPCSIVVRRVSSFWRCPGVESLSGCSLPGWGSLAAPAARAVRALRAHGGEPADHVVPVLRSGRIDAAQPLHRVFRGQRPAGRRLWRSTRSPACLAERIAGNHGIRLSPALRRRACRRWCSTRASTASRCC